jgi:hypothetical protein
MAAILWVLVWGRKPTLKAFASACMWAMLRSKMVRSTNKKGVGTASSKRLRPTHRSASRAVIAIASYPLLAVSLLATRQLATLSHNVGR